MTETPAPKPRKGRPTGSSMHRYLGRAGEARVMSELLIRGYNVAAPQVDEGHDLFVVSSPNATLVRAVQVKAAFQPSSGHQPFQFGNVKLSQLTTDLKLFFIFVFYRAEDCRGLLILSARDLFGRYAHQQGQDPSSLILSPTTPPLTIPIKLTNGHATFWGGQAPLNDWRDFPTIPR